MKPKTNTHEITKRIGNDPNARAKAKRLKGKPQPNRALKKIQRFKAQKGG